MDTTLQQVLTESEQMPIRSCKFPVEIRALLSALQKPPALRGDRRNGNRQPYLAEAIIHYEDVNQQLSRARVYTRNVSGHMLAIVTETHLKVGTSIVLELPWADGLARQLKGQVRRCRQFREGWFDVVVQEEAALRKASSAGTVWTRLTRLVTGR